MHDWVKYLIFRLYDVQGGESGAANEMTLAVNNYLNLLRTSKATNISFSTTIASGDSKGAHLALVTFTYISDTEIILDSPICDD